VLYPAIVSTPYACNESYVAAITIDCDINKNDAINTNNNFLNVLIIYTNKSTNYTGKKANSKERASLMNTNLIIFSRIIQII
jgi:hypothetical protein